MENSRKAAILVMACLAFTALAYVFKPGGQLFVPLSDSLAVAYSAVALLLGLCAMRLYNLRSLHGKSLFLIAAGISLWFAAEVIWLAMGSQVRYLLEGLRLGGYVPITAGFFFISRMSNPRLEGERMHYIYLTAGFLVFSSSYLAVVYAFLGIGSLLGIIVTYGYLIADFTLLFGIALLIRAYHSFRGGYMSKVWVVFALAFLAVLAFDVNFALNHETYMQGDISEVLWLANYLLLSLGFYLNIYIVSHLRRLVTGKASKKPG